MVLIWFALLSYAIAPLVVFFLTQKKREEGQIWLVFLTGSVISSLFVFLNSMVHIQDSSPFLWFPTNSMILALGLQWEKADWILQQFIALYLLVFVLKGYLDRERESLRRNEIAILFFTTFCGIFALSVNREFLLVSFLFGLDVIRLLKRFLDQKELISSRRDTISLLLRFISIVLLTYFSALVDIGGIGSTFLLQFFLIAGISFIRLVADYIDQVSRQNASPKNLRGWFIFLDSVILIRMMSLIPDISSELTGIYLVLLIILGILFLSILVLLFWQTGLFKHDFTIYPVCFLLAVMLLLMGIREELLFLVLPLFFLQINSQIPAEKFWSGVLQIGELIFLIALPFSPIYLLSKALMNLQLSLPIVYSVLLFIGFYLACFVIIQIRSNKFPAQESESKISLWIVLAGMLLILIKGFFQIGGLDQISWMAFSPTVGFILLPVELLIHRKQEAGEITRVNHNIGNAPALVIEKIIQIFLTISDVFRQIFEGIGAVFEGEGGLLWAIILMILLLTLFKGLS